MDKISHSLKQAKILVDRLARLSADSKWARRASGLRASLDKAIGQIEDGRVVEPDQIEDLISIGFDMLEKAGREVPVPEEILSGNKSPK
jgi:hypothetical protein